MLCTHSSQCPDGQGCVGNLCVPLPCGGCDSDQVCVSNACVPAQGAPCPSASVGGCPEGYTCNSNNVCSTPCTLDSDCAMGLVCDSDLGTCAQCVYDSSCTTVTGKPRCDPTSGNCVACLQPVDCTSGSFCDTTSHTCVMGCEVNGDCNLSEGEYCLGATATTPGKCVQCTVATQATDCPVAAQACNANGRCVVCTSDSFCTVLPRCDLATNTCVECLPADNDAGSDCGYTGLGTHDPHNEMVCDPVGLDCVAGCTSDANCGCPIDPGTHKQTSCIREYSQEHCDPARTHSADVAADAGTEGGCVECTQDSHCFCKVSGNLGSTDPSTGLSCAMWPGGGTLDGARCVADACVVGCNTNDDCPADKICSLSGPTANTCVECSCANATINDNFPGGTCSSSSETCGWCSDPQTASALGGCGPVTAGNTSGAYKVCDAKTLTCRLKRQDEQCAASIECGDTMDPTVGQCIPGAQFCIEFAHAYALGSPNEYCATNHTSGRCGIACDDPQDNLCASGVNCPSGSTCDQATAVDTPPNGVANSGEYCTSNLCTH